MGRPVAELKLGVGTKSGYNRASEGSRLRCCHFMLILLSYGFGFILSAAQFVFGWYMVPRTPNEPPPSGSSSDSHFYTYHDALVLLALYSTLVCPMWIGMTLYFWAERKQSAYARLGGYKGPILFMAAVRTIPFMAVLRPPRTPAFTQLVSSCTAVGFRSHACAPLGVLMLLPVAELVPGIFILLIPGRLIERGGATRIEPSLTPAPLVDHPPTNAWPMDNLGEMGPRAEGTRNKHKHR
ncbi:hypothetical protein B0H16DRAFT_1703335 [Mycena metata]|uniref:Uncharacterized protein n=1 Tax=Mycena metata TaxID=1033252 RepID=A0AAD7MDJ4_9AGAR|nr:hypothetical protein B0H16DRAFT_1703335 [Mycena metata]